MPATLSHGFVGDHRGGTFNAFHRRVGTDHRIGALRGGRPASASEQLGEAYSGAPGGVVHHWGTSGITRDSVHYPGQYDNPRALTAASAWRPSSPKRSTRRLYVVKSGSP